MLGKTLNHYEIGEQLGKGGMGEVYQAKDQKLGREVAIKVLPEEFAKDADRVARFQREAKLLASLNHPNIAAIYGLEESSGTNFLVLELVEGETLADRIKVGPIPVEDSLKLALQIAEALEAAHEKGVIHRDLKPANIKVTPDGKVKVLDFGLAKAFAGEQAELNLSNSPTLSNAATQQGVILGTAAYMSPEQARGKSVDKRTDIWAFGCVLFEMLAGSAAFSGKDVTDILAAVIRSDPEWDRLPPNLHWRLREVLERCLKKDPNDRYHDIADVLADIQIVLADSGGELARQVNKTEPVMRLRTIFPWVAAILVLSAITGAVVWNVRTPEPPRVIRFDFELPEGQQFSGAPLAISPDGSQLVYSTSKGLYLRSMHDLTAGFITGTDENPNYPFFSPDGQWVGYWSASSNQLKKIPISGGAPVTLTNASNPNNPTWGPDEKILYAQGQGIMRISANGGTPELLVKADGKTLKAPQILPDGESVLFSEITSNPDKVMVQSLESGKRKELFPGNSARYLPTGHIVYTVGTNLFAIAFDLETLNATGGSVPIMEGVFRRNQTASATYAVSDSGTLVYVPGTMGLISSQRTLAWVDWSGKEEPLEIPPNAYSYPRISPDGARVALTAGPFGNSDIWIWDLARKILTRLTLDAASDGSPLWTPDGKRIAFSSDREQTYRVYWKAADGTGEDELLSSAPGRAIFPWSWAGDGKTMVLGEFFEGTGLDIGTLSMEGERKWSPMLKEKHSEAQPQVSPDGRWIAYVSNESGKDEIYVRPFPEVNKGKWPISTSGGISPLWSRDGRELFYRSGDAVMAVPVKTDRIFSYETPKVLFRGTYATQGGIASAWDISRDGKRFLMIKDPESTASSAGGPRKINIVLNWFEELKQRVPVK